MKIPTKHLWRHPNFLRLWSAESISAFGDTISEVALPLTAIITLNASAAEMGILKALDNAPILLFGLFIGVWVDRVRRRPLMITTQFGLGILLATIPVAAVLGILRIEQLYLVSFCSGTLSAIYMLSSTSFLPSVVDRQNLVEGNAKLSVSRSTAKVVGPGFAGILVEFFTAPLTILLDALSFLISGVCLLFVNTSETVEAATSTKQGVWREIGEGLRMIFRHPILAPMTIGTAIGSFAGSIQGTVFILYLTRELMLSPTWLGIILASAGVASLLGAIVARQSAQRYGSGWMLIGTTLLISIGMGLVPLASTVSIFIIPILIVAQIFQSSGLTVYSITQISLRQTLTPDELLGRVNASRRVLVFGVIPFGAMIGGVLGETIGLQLTLVLAALVGFASFVFHLYSPLRQVTDFREMSSVDK